MLTVRNLNILVIVLYQVTEGNSLHHRCGGPVGISHVKFPDKQGLLSLDNFQQHFVGRTLHEMYFVAPRPPPFLPDISYKATITAMSEIGNFLVSTRGITMGPNPGCVTNEVMLQPADVSGRALFFYGDNTTVQAYMSECPSSYIVSVRCQQYNFAKRRCPPNSAFIGIYLLDSMDDVPLSDIAAELCRNLGVKFGVQDLKWFYTFGANNLC